MDKNVWTGEGEVIQWVGVFLWGRGVGIKNVQGGADLTAVRLNRKTFYVFREIVSNSKREELLEGLGF